MLVLLAAGLEVLFAAPGLAADREDGELRLTGGGNKGRLQVYYNGRWGGVCDDGFGQEEADVACRQLDFPQADRYESRTHWSLSFPIWLDDVVCDGNEERLSDCSHTAWGGHNCSRQEHVWVQCTVATPTANPAVLVRPKSFPMDEDSTATYKVWLGTEPSADVTVTVGGTIAGVTVAPASLTFTTTDWDWDSRKTVTVSAADDLNTTDESVTLTHTPSGGGYGSAATDEVSVTVRDDDIPGVVIDRQVVTIDEGDTTGATYAVVLTGRPSADVTVTVAGHSGTDVSVQPATLTFGTMDWITPQTVTVTAAADGDKVSDTVTLTHSASGGSYDGLAIPAVDVRVQDKDIEVAASPARLTVDENGTATYALQTVGGPWDSLTVAVQPPADAGFTVSPSTVTFTRSDWDSPKTVRVAGQRDDDWSDDTWTIAHSAEGSGPGTVPAASVAVTVDDLGSPGAWIDDGGIVTLDEGSSGTYRISLMRNPRGTATVSLSSSSSSKLSVSPSSLSFDSSNWSQSRTVTIEALQEDDDSADETVRVRHGIAQGGLEASLRSTQVRITDDDDGEGLIGSRPEAANVWWAALTAASETGGVVGHIDYREPFPDTGKLSDDTFTYDGIGREIDAVYLDRTGHFQIWVDSGNGSALPNDVVLHVGSAKMTLGSATQQSFGTTYTEGMTPMVREHTYWWQAGSHSVSLTSRQAVAVWLEEPDGTRSVPGPPQDVQGTPGDGKLKLEWEPPSGNGTKSAQQVLHYEYQQEGAEGWTETDGPETTEEVPDLVNGESYRFRVRAVNAEGKGAASAPSAPVTPAEAEGLTGEFVSVPASHDGSSAFTLQIEFSDEIAPRFRRKRNHVFEVTGGAVQDLRRVNRRRDLWTLTVAPSSDAAVAIVMPADRACDAAGAVCTAAGDRLSEAVEATVPGPPPTVSITAGTSPVTEGEAATFTLTRTGDTAGTLTVALSVTEAGAVLSGTPATEVVFSAGATTAALSVATEDDEVVESASLVTVSVDTGTGYTVDASAGSAAVTVEDDDAAPALAGATVDGTTLALSFDEALDESSTPDTSAFAVTVESVSRAVDAVEVSGSSVTLTLASAVGAGETVTVGYTVPANAIASPLQDAAGNAAAGFSDQAVANETVAINAAPTGLPTIGGTVRVGEMLTAYATGVADADGLTDTTFGWQWIANDGVTDTDIAGATAARYTLTPAEVGKTIKVRVTFTDDGGTEEALTSAATATVEAQLTARFASLPASHDGETSFSFELYFSEDVSIGGQALRQNALEVTGGSIASVQRLDPASSTGWTITLAPSTDDRLMIRIRTRETCSEAGAICTAAGKPLLNQLAETVQGPSALAAPIIAQAGAGEPVTVPTDWSLKPDGVAEGEKFRLVFVTSGRSAADSGSIGTYDAFIQRHANGGHLDIRQYGSRFKILGSTQNVDARDHTGSNPRLDRGGPGVPIYWLNGPKAADDYRDFYDDGWDHFNPGRDESGASVHFGNADTVWTGTQHGGQSDADGYLGHATIMRVGRPYNNNPLSRGDIVKSAERNAGRMYGLSPVFQVAVAEAAEPSVSIAAGTSPVTEGEAATFTLERTGDTAAALTVALSVTEDGTVLSGTPAAEVAFAAGAATAELSVATEDDGTAEADGRVTASVSAGSGYGVDADAGAASVDVFDNDQASAAAAAETLWSSTLEWTDMGGGWLIAYAESFSSASWSEDGHSFSIWYIAYDSANGELWLQLTSEMPAGGIPEPAELTIQVGEATVGPGDAMAAFAAGSIGIASGVEQSWSAGESVPVHLTRAVETEETAADGPGISVADAEVREAEGAVLSFPVTLDAAQASAVSVRYATSDGTAVAGADYEAVSGAVRFEAGETEKTVSVPVLNDTHNEGSETLTLVLSDPFAAVLADGEATGTIVNTGPMPQAWITRFGRTVAQQAVDAIGDRLSGVGRDHGTQVTIGGVELVGSGAYAGALLDNEATDWPVGAHDLEGSDPAETGRGVTGRELLLGSALQFGAGGEDGGPSWTAWGRVATGGFEGEDSGLSLSGDVTTGFLGADLSLEHWLAGVALGLSEGEGSFDDGAGSGGGTVESSLTGVYPYARLDVGDGVDVWGLVGMGSGDLTLVVGEEMTETDLSMQMGAAGLRSALAEADEPGAIDLALKADALWVRTESDAARSSTGGNLEAARGTASRLRVALEGSQSLAMGAGATFTPTLELGLRHDGGDAETGTGVEAGLGLQYAAPAPGLTVEGRVRGLLTHAAQGYEEWGASGSIRLDPGLSGRGVSLSVTPAWGAASGDVDRLWATRPAAGLLADDGFGSQARLHAELGYGMHPPLGHGVLTPYAGFSLAGEGDGRTYRLGARWRGTSSFHVALEASHGEADEEGTPDTAAILRAEYRW